MTGPPSALDELQAKLGSRWVAIEKARAKAAEVLSELPSILHGQDSDATRVVAYGSLARREWTSGSDVDWTLLVDGGVDPQHLTAAERIAKLLEEAKYREPGRTGTFASLSSSHDLVHKIGGQEDTNQNTTRRILLLLESIPLGKPAAYVRVKRSILHRYIDEDRGLRYGSASFVPRFLLNDIARYWRTMAVDFAQKQRERGGSGSGLRNAKLRMSRKLIFTSGLLICLQCELDPATEVIRASRREPETSALLLAYLESRLERRPLEILAEAVAHFSKDLSTAISLFGSYDKSLTILDDDEGRNYLDRLEPKGFDGDPIFDEVRKLSHEFQSGLNQLFFESNDELTELTQKYGVF